MEVTGLRVAARRRPLRIAGIACALWLAMVAVAVAGSASPLLAADPVTFGEGTATSKFAEFVDVKQPVTLASAPDRVEVLVATPGSVGPSVVPLGEPTASGSTTLDYRIDLADGHIVPNTTFTIRFRVIDTGGRSWLGPVIRHTYADDRFEWKELEGKVVRVHWTEGGQAFGQRALRIGDDAVAATADCSESPRANRSTSSSTPIRRPSTTPWAPRRGRTSAARLTRISGRCSRSSRLPTSMRAGWRASSLTS